MRRLIIVLCFLLSPRLLHAQAACSSASCPAATCAEADVLAAWPTSGNTNPTVTVTLPPCTGGSAGNWSSTFSAAQPSAVTTLIVQGSTTVSCTWGFTIPTVSDSCTATDGSVIIDNLAGGSSLITITTGAAGTSFRWTGITIQGGTGGAKHTVQVSGYSQHVRFDHSNFNASTYGATGFQLLTFSNWQYGVVDHSVFTSTAGTLNNGIHVNHDTYNGHISGNGSWADAENFGSAAFIFIENNYFAYGKFANDCGAGGRFVWRNNVMLGAEIQSHPTQGSPTRGCKEMEVYNNFFGPYSTLGEMVRFEAGTGLVWGNTASPSGAAGYKSMISLTSYRRTGKDDGGAYDEVPTPNGWGYAGSSFCANFPASSGCPQTNGDGTSSWDQNGTTTTGYAALDDSARCYGDLLSDSAFPNVVNTAQGNVIAWPRQPSCPIYDWQNTWATYSGGGGSRFGLPTYDSLSMFTANVDFYAYQISGCSGTQTTGTCAGLYANRAGTCTQGVGYFATDIGAQGTLYVCNGSNTFVSSYAPYQYPHPLDTSGTGSQLSGVTCLGCTIQ